MPQPGIEPWTPAWQTRAQPTELLRLADQKHDLCLVMWPQKEKMHPYAWKVNAPRENNSQAHFPFLERTFLSSICTVRSRKVKFSRGMKSMPSSFSPSEHSLSRHREHIFLVISRNKSGTICRKQFPWHVRHIPVWKRSISKWGIFKSLIP